MAEADNTRLPWKWDGDDLWHVGESYDSATDPHRYTGISINKKLRGSPTLKANMQLIEQWSSRTPLETELIEALNDCVEVMKELGGCKFERHNAEAVLARAAAGLV